MRKQWLVALLPVLCLLVPTIAHADTIDDFHLTGGGYTITFSLPATPTTFVPIGRPGSNDVFDINAEVDANGTEFNQTLQFLGTRLISGAGLVFDNGIPDPNPGAGGQPLRILGAQLYSWTTEAAPTFLTGTFNMRDFYGLTPTIPYTLTITPESTTPAAVPEPSTLVLIATGCSSLVGLARRKRLS